MFEGISIPPQPSSSSNQPASPGLGQPEQVSPPQRIYTMPEKFMQPRKAAASGKAKKWIVIATICGAILLVLVAIIVYAFQVSSSQRGGTQNINVSGVINDQVNGANENDNQNANENANQSGNENDNSNSGATLNVNVDDTLGNNINAGLFPNRNTNTNSNTSSTIPPSDRSDVGDGRDKDRDGLTDVEEDLYATRFDKPDSDKDGYVDGTEVRNLFSPTNEGETLLESGAVIEYAQAEFGWSIYYPADWIAEPVNDTKTEVMFASDTVDGEFVEVLVTENTKHQTAAEWYAALYEDVDPDDFEAVTLGKLQGIVTPDGFAYYLADDQYIIGIIYNFGTKDEVQFRTTFEMMAESFVYTAVKTEDTDDTNSNSNANSNTNSNSANTNS